MIETLDKNYYEALCDFCDFKTTYDVDDWQDLMRQMRDDDWQIRKDETGAWTHKCFRCAGQNPPKGEKGEG